MLPYEQYPVEESLHYGCHLLKKLINLHGGQLDVATNIHLKSCEYHPSNMLKSADLHETILTPVTCHKHIRYHDAVFLCDVSVGRSKEDEKWIFFIYVSRFPLSEVKTTKKKERKTLIERS